MRKVIFSVLILLFSEVLMAQSPKLTPKGVYDIAPGSLSSTECEKTVG